MENTRRAASAHPDGVAARERDDAAFDCRGNGRVAEHGEPGAHGHGGIKALKPRPSGGRTRENMTLKEEKALLVRFAKAAGAGEMVNIHHPKAAYEKAIGHETSKSTIYNLLARHGWRKLMPRPFHCGSCSPMKRVSAASTGHGHAGHRSASGPRSPPSSFANTSICTARSLRRMGLVSI